MSRIVFDVISIILPIFIVLGSAYIFKKKKLVKQEVIDGIKFLIVNLMLPAVVFGAFYKAEFRKDTIVIVVIMLLCWIICFFLGYFIKYVFKIEKESFMPYMTTVAETGMFGYSLYSMLFNRERLPYLAVIDLSQGFIVFLVIFPLLYKRKGLSTVECIKSYSKMPMLIALILGILVSVTGLGKIITTSMFGSFLETLLSYFEAPVSLLILFVIGYGLDFAKKQIKDAVFIVVCRMVVMGGLCAISLFVIQLFVSLSPYLFYGIILIFTLPPIFMLSMFTRNENESACVSACLSLYTLISIVAFLVLVVVVFSQGLMSFQI